MYLLIILITTVFEKGSGDYVFPEFAFTQEPQDILMVHNQPGSLSCSASTSHSAVKIQWKRNGQYLQFPDFNGRRRLLSNGSLYFSTVYDDSDNDSTDEGIYQCVAEVDGLGKIVSKTAVLLVEEEQRFEVEPSDISVFLGQTAGFECILESRGEISTSSAFSPTWLKDDQPLNVNDHRISVKPSGMLEISDVNLSDRAEYRCNASGLLSGMAKLTINLDPASSSVPSPPEFIIFPKSRRVLEGSSVILDCGANGVPQPEISWLKDGSTLDTSHLDSRTTKIGRGSLKIKDLRSEEDSGTYQCRAENSEDSKDVMAVVEVQSAPIFLKKPANKVSYEKGDILFECRVRSFPSSEIQWYKNGELIVESDYFQIVDGSDLKILGLVESDGGMYQCVATNSVGNVQASAQLKVLTEDSSPTLSASPSESNLSSESSLFPKLPSAPKDVRVAIVATRFITLTWSPPEEKRGTIVGYSMFYKEKDSERERVLNSTRGGLAEINIQGLTPGTEYVFRVLAHNEHGAGEDSKPLVVSTQDDVDVPGSVLNLKCRATASFSILVYWEKPSRESGFITQYKVYYRQGEYGSEKWGTSKEMKYHLTDLREYTEYTFWVSASNSNGEGLLSEEITCLTYSDIPADPPQNVTLEAGSSKSLLVRWEPPPKESQNGIITGYKIRYRKKGRGKSEIVTTDGSRRLFAITNLRVGMEYQIKLAAMTVNGTGPATPWIAISTFASDLDETIVPDQPSSLRARATDDEISILWTPPRDSRILVRGYRMGWGKGVPDEYIHVVDEKQRFFRISDLKPNSEYVISLRAYNDIGDGRPIYETVRTREEYEDEIITPLIPPVGLHAIVLSSYTVVLTWMDSSLPRNQVVSDNRYYIVRYAPADKSPAKYQYRNSTDLNCMIDDLRANTEYEFTVKIIKGRRMSPWSLVAVNKTLEAEPSSPPRDLTIMTLGDGSVELRWRPPKYTNGRINGYIIQYTTNRKAEERDWYVEPVIGDRTRVTIDNLEMETKYFFKISARNNKGYGPSGQVVSFRTPKDPSRGFSKANDSVSPVMLYAVFGVGAGIVIVLIVGAALLVRSKIMASVPNENRRNKNYIQNDGGNGGAREKLNPPPPDLWIGHDQLELKVMDGDETGETTLGRSTPDYRSASSMDRSRFNAPFSASDSERSYPLTNGGSRLSSVVSGRTSADQSTMALLPHNKSVKIAAINGKPPRVQRYMSKESVASSSAQTNGSCSGSGTYIRSQYSLDPPSIMCSNNAMSLESPGDLPPPGYDSSICAPSDDCPSSSALGDLSWGGTVNNIGPSLIDGSSASNSNVIAPPQLPPAYLSSAMSTTSSENSSSAGSGHTRSSRLPLKSFRAPSPSHQQPKNQIRPPPSSPFKRPLMGSLNVNGPLKLGSLSSDSPSSCSSSSTGGSSSHHNSLLNNQLENNSQYSTGHLPAIADVRSPDVLHPQDGPCDCLSHPIPHSLSTEELNADLKNLEGLMKDLTSMAPSNQFNC